MIPAGDAADTKSKTQQQQQQQQPVSQSQSVFDEYYNDWDGNEEAESDETGDILGHSLVDDVNNVDRQVESLISRICLQNESSSVSLFLTAS